MVSPSSRRALGPSAIVALALGLAACGGGGSSGGLGEQADRGRQLALDNGCASCHGAQGQGGVGPAWTGLAGSEVELTDGSTVVADDAYLRRAILQPDAEEVAGYTIKMPSNGLSEAQADDIVAYIDELADAPEA